MRMCWPSDSRQPCSAFSCIAVTTASPSGMDRQRGVAAFPLQLARGVGLGADEPQRGAVVVRRADPLAFGIERQAGDRGRMRQLLQLLPGLVEQMHDLADRAAISPLPLSSGVGRDVLDPFHAETGDVGRPRRRRRCGASLPSSPPVTKPRRARPAPAPAPRRRAARRVRQVSPSATATELHACRRQARSRACGRRGRSGRRRRTRPSVARMPRGLQQKAGQVWLIGLRSSRVSPPRSLRTRAAAAGGSGCGR